jgi:hypothetical protein
MNKYIILILLSLISFNRMVMADDQNQPDPLQGAAPTPYDENRDQPPQPAPVVQNQDNLNNGQPNPDPNNGNQPQQDSYNNQQQQQ